VGRRIGLPIYFLGRKMELVFLDIAVETTFTATYLDKNSRLDDSSYNVKTLSGY